MLSHQPLLQLQRDLYDIPPGRERFDTYIATMRDEDGDMKLPLPAMNPMAKDHVPALLDAYLALGADEVAQAIIKNMAQVRIAVLRTHLSSFHQQLGVLAFRNKIFMNLFYFSYFTSFLTGIWSSEDQVK